METLALTLAALLTVLCVLFVARPLLGPARRGGDGLVTPSPEEEARRRLLEERDRALAALKELEFDHRTGKVSDEDYRELVAPLRRQAGEALRALEHELGPKREELKADVHG